MDKYNLIIIPGFGMNSSLSEGLLKFLNEHFNVYFIKFPGFTKDIPPLKEFNVATISEYTRKQIDKLNLKSYYIGSVSLGFCISQNLNFPKGCEGYIAIHPYINSSGLELSKFLQNSLYILSSILIKMNLANSFFSSRFCRYLFENNPMLLKKHPKSDIDSLLLEIEGKTYFEGVKTILSYKDDIKFDKSLPYVLLANPSDKAVNYQFTTDYFKKESDNLLILDSKWDHFPKDLSYEYFKNNVPENFFERIIKFLKSN